MCSRVWRAWRARVQLALVLVARLERRQVGVERDLRVDDDQLAAGQAHEHVRPQRALVASGSCSARRSRSARPCPAISTTLRSWISPQEPRVAGRFSAETRLPVSWRSVPTPSPSWRIICASSPCAWRRSRSRRPISLSIRPSFSCTGLTMPLISSARRGHLAGSRAPPRRGGVAEALRRATSPVWREHVDARSPSAPRAAARGSRRVRHAPRSAPQRAARAPTPTQQSEHPSA